MALVAAPAALSSRMSGRHASRQMASPAAGLPSINVSPPQGKLLQLLARMQGARSILEIGTLGGYSTIWLGRALPRGGKLVTLEIDPKHAEIARATITASADETPRLQEICR